MPWHRAVVQRSSVMPVGVGLAAALLYMATLSHHYTADSVQLALAVDENDWSRLLSPYHPLLGVVQWGAARLVDHAGIAATTLQTLQIINALAAGCAVGLVCALTLAATESPVLATLGAIGFAVSGASWLLGTEAELAFLALPPALVVIGQAASISRGKALRRPIRLGLLVGIATLAYATNLSLLAVVAAASWVGGTGPGRERRRAFASVVSSALLVVAFACGAMLVAGRTNLSAYLDRSDLGELGPSSIYRSAYALLRSFALYPGLGMNDRTLVFLQGATRGVKLTFALRYLAVAILLLLPAALGLWNWRATRSSSPLKSGRRSESESAARSSRPVFQRAAGPSLAVLAVWAGCAAAFALFWVPGDLTFWLPVVAAWWMASAVAAASSRHTERAAFAAFVVVVGLGAVNYAALVGPHRDASTNELLWLARRLETETSPADAIFSEHLGVQLYARYFSHRQAGPVSALKGPAGRERVARLTARGGRAVVIGSPGSEVPPWVPWSLEHIWKQAEFEVSVVQP